MDTFWKWLMRADARVVLPCALGALILVSGWWTWKLLSPVKSPLPNITPVQKAKFRSPLAFTNCLADPDSVPAFTSSRNPFEAPFRWVIPRDTNDVAVTPTTIPVPSTGTVTHAHTDPPPPKPKTTLTYHGMFERADGTILALIGNSVAGKSSFYAATGIVGSLRISGISTQELFLVTSDGVTNTIPFGKSYSFDP